MKAETSELRTSCVDLISATHCRQREQERQIFKQDLQAAVKYGTCEESHHPTHSKLRYKFVYDGIVYITEADKTTSVTCWAENQLPLEAAPLSTSELKQIAEKKRRVHQGLTKCTSHTVLVVDQSGSMKKADVVGHRTRSRGVFYTIASEMIAAPLLHNLMNFTDTLSLIEMRDQAVVAPEFENQPISWDLHNAVVKLAEEPMRAGGNGNYIPALEKAYELLRKYDNGNCALFLLFLSDGKPSDAHTTGATHRLKQSMPQRQDTINATIVDYTSAICNKFRDRLTLGAFGFAHDHDGTTFGLLEEMAFAANAAGSHGVFSSGLDTTLLRRSLGIMTTSLISTRTSLSSLAGGSMLRDSVHKKVKRTDHVKDTSRDDYDTAIIFDPSKYDFYWIKGDNLKRYVSKRQEGELEFQVVDMKHPEAQGVAMKKAYLGIGAERAAYELTEIDIHGQPIGQPLVGKESIHEEPSQYDFHYNCARTQMFALKIAKKFIESCKERGIEVLPIEFLACSFYDWGKNREYAILAEKSLDFRKYCKFNDNKGGVNTVNRDPAMDAQKNQLEDVTAHAIDAIEEGSEDEEESSDEESDNEEKRKAIDTSRIIDDDVPQAFSHWSYQYTWGDNLVCDLQGVKGTTSFQLTDPAVHSKGQTYGMTDRGSRGMEDFWSTHQCNALCEALKLRMPEKNKKKTWRSKGGGRKVTEGHSMGAKEK